MTIIQCDLCGTYIGVGEAATIVYTPAEEDDVRPCEKIGNEFYTYKTKRTYDLCCACCTKILMTLNPNDKVLTPNGIPLEEDKDLLPDVEK